MAKFGAVDKFCRKVLTKFWEGFTITVGLKRKVIRKEISEIFYTDRQQEGGLR